MSIQVAEEGNRRVGDMDRAEIRQSILDITSWFKRSSNCLDHAEGARSSDIESLEKAVDVALPEGLELLLTEQDGHLWFADKQALGCRAMMKAALCLEETSRSWRSGMIPFAADEEGNHLVADARAKGAPVLEWEMDSGEGCLVAPTFSRFLEDSRDQLLSGRVEFVKGLGVVEKVGAPAGIRGGKPREMRK